MRRTSKTEFKVFNKDSQINIDDYNGVTFFNQGNVTVVLNGVLKLKPNMQISIKQSDPDVLDITEYYFHFDLTDADTTGTNTSMVIITTNVKLKA